MCGIAGQIALNGSRVTLAEVQAMNDRLRHRGPDGAGFMLARREAEGFAHTFVEHTSAWPAVTPVHVALGHRRLAILDLSERGRQPMPAAGGHVWLVFNGEIYNHRALRAQFVRDGVAFETRTDTEVLLAAYQRWGDACVEHLDGMYAFAIWDGDRRRLFCARDRLGIKPFYYAVTRDAFVFGSEIKALLACSQVRAVIHPDAVVEFLVHSNCDYGERTMFRGIRSLPAAHTLAVVPATQSLRIVRYWSLAAAASPKRPAEAVERLRTMLMASTREHLVSDVRAGSCLSGGLDSSTVVSLVREVREGDPAAAAAVGDRLTTFTSCYDDPRFDEREYALAAAGAAGAAPQLVFPNPIDFWSDFAAMAWHQDMPFGSFSYYAQWRVMRAAQQAGVKVLLDGQGGDEVFGGYAKVRYAYFASLLRAGRVSRLARELAATLHHGDRYVLDLRNGYRYLPQQLRALFKVDTALRDVLRGDWDTATQGESVPATRWWRYAAGRYGNGNGHGFGETGTLLQQVQIDDIVIDTLPQLLRMEDRSSMAFSIEARVPLLDHHLVEYGVSLPDGLKIHNGWSKFAVREAMRGLMPEQVRLRKTKLGFAAPDRCWLQHDLRRHVDDLLSSPLRCEPFIDSARLRRWYRSTQAAHANTESYLGLFRILSLEMWMRTYGLSA